MAEERRGIPGRQGWRDGWGLLLYGRACRRVGGSANHRGAISNAYQASVHFSWKVGLLKGTSGLHTGFRWRRPARGDDAGKHVGACTGARTDSSCHVGGAAKFKFKYQTQRRNLFRLRFTAGGAERLQREPAHPLSFQSGFAALRTAKGSGARRRARDRRLILMDDSASKDGNV